MATFSARKLSNEASLSVLFEELEAVKWDLIGLSEVMRTREAYKVLKKGCILCYHGLVDRRELGVGFLMHRNIAGNIGKYYSISEKVASIVIMFNKKHILYEMQKRIIET